MARRRPDRAQTFRTRRQWWNRHGAFVRGLLAGITMTLLAVWVLRSFGVR